ncbi:unnamed protein product [Adineta steineri]|uniref:Poly [ADP-ribose] polymerase n=1 Tax=Adineta steineri TaxID=433720 RepID=A0A814GW21_9BILA|nr:unnamed protein product [Adineta steineri]
MDTDVDYPSFDLQSINVSIEERRWILKQRQLYKLDNLIQSIADLHKTIRGSEQFSYIPTSLSSSSMIKKGSLDETYPLYYSSTVDGCTNNDIDQFRLHHQQTFQLVFQDLCTDFNYRIFIIIMEGLIFYSSQTVKEYTSTIIVEMRKCLTSFHTYIQSRASKIIDFISLLPKQSLPHYTIVHTNHENNIGILFQLCPKIEYYLTSTDKCQWHSLVSIDEYKKHVISPEELRYIDYLMDMKSKRYIGSVRSEETNMSRLTYVPFTAVPSLVFQTLHSLPIIYPYDNNMTYNQKYPLFWTGTNHLNDNSDILFENIQIEKTTPEYLFVERLFHKTVMKPNVDIAIIERIQNPHLWEKFSSHRSYMRRKNGNQNLNENWLFHGTKSDNHHQIISHGFNRSYCRDYVLFGRGVYFSRYANYSCNYGDRKDLSFIFLCRVLVGHHTEGSNDIHVPPMINSNNGKQIQADSTTDHKNPHTIVCTFHDDQTYPEYIITYLNK